MFSKKEPEWHWMPSLEIWVWWVKDLLWPANSPHSSSTEYVKSSGVDVKNRRVECSGIEARFQDCTIVKTSPGEESTHCSSIATASCYDGRLADLVCTVALHHNYYG